MKVIYNFRVLSAKELSMSFDNRGFCYGDALFETIVTGSGEINLIEAHLQRLAKGCLLLGINMPKELNEKELSGQIDTLKIANALSGRIRSKLSLWREPGGRYAPLSSDCSYLLQVQPQSSPFFRQAESIGISQHYHNSYSPFSFAKTTNALHYVLAGKEMNEEQWDDIILLDTNGYLSETHTSNLFWSSQGQIFTPDLATGCIEGVMRNYLIDSCLMHNQPIRQAKAKPQVLAEADTIFTTNASGIQYFKKMSERSYGSPKALLQKFLKPLQAL